MADSAATVADPRAQSAAAFERARKLMPGGVSSPVRAYQAVGIDPIFIRSGKGALVTDIDGNEYIDYVGSYGPLILGHAAEPVTIALQKAINKGTSFGMPTEAESTLAEMVIDAVPSIERVRFVNSGTEATMSAIRLARAATGRSKVVKCTGCYHGHSDALLVQAGSGATTLGVPSSAGVPEALTQNTLLVPFNDLAAVARVFDEHGPEIACMALEPVAGNMGCILPADGYLQGLRDLCDRHGALLLFDEVMTGFRVAYGGAQARFGVTPDLTCLGKVVGGGMPCAAYGGRDDLMRHVAPEGPMYQAGTLSGNPLAMAAGIATVEALSEAGVYEALDKATTDLALGLEKAAAEAGLETQVRVAHVGSMLCPFFSDAPVTDYESALRCRTDRFAAFFRSMLDQGVVLPPSQFETWFISTAHDAATIRKTTEAAKKAFAAAAEVA